ncbi:DUF3820 family protein [Flavobacteriaceae bacterium S0862]|jgi:uncharacterized protein (DUF3820 family)|nr:DUF3820 family protein [Flavobacteriaceae bacterium S0862]
MLNENQSKQFLVKLANTKMPYGKYKGRYMIDLPEHYVVWYRSKGFPKGQIGEMLATVYELKVNGLEELVRTIRRTS